MLRVLEVCTESSPAYALVFTRAQRLNQSYPQHLQIDLLCSEGKEVALMRAQGMNIITTTLHRSLRPIRLLRSLYNLHRVLRTHTYDVIHLHFGVPGLVGRLLACVQRGPVWIYQSHGYSLAANTGWLSRYVYLIVERLLKHTVHYALFQSHEDITLARRYRLLNKPQIIYLGNGIDTQRFTPRLIAQLPSIQPPAGLIDHPPDVIVFGMVARFEHIKNHQLFIDAIKYLRLKTTHFKVYLIGQGALKNMIQAQITAHALDEQVTILPFSHDMPAFYQQIDVGVLTSYGEGLPRALLEPMACGRPVLCTDVKGSREAVKPGKTGFILPLGQPERLATKMQWCIEHPDKLLALGRAARQHVLQHFDEEQVINRLATVYLHCHPEFREQPGAQTPALKTGGGT